MTSSHEPPDPYNLSRFVEAQEGDYEQAISELRSGKKRTHWMWYIFPQIDGLAFSSISKHYAIKSICVIVASDLQITDRNPASIRDTDAAAVPRVDKGAGKRYLVAIIVIIGDP